MIGPKEIIATTFALLVVVIYLVACVFTINPFLEENFISLDDAIAVYTDTLATVWGGNVRIPVEPGSIDTVVVAYKKKGTREKPVEGFVYSNIFPVKQREIIPEDGWYVVAAYRTPASNNIISSSKINSYPFEAFDVATTIYGPTAVCVNKAPTSDIARAGRC